MTKMRILVRSVYISRKRSFTKASISVVNFFGAPAPERARFKLSGLPLAIADAQRAMVVNATPKVFTNDFRLIPALYRRANNNLKS